MAGGSSWDDVERLQAEVVSLHEEIARYDERLRDRTNRQEAAEATLEAVRAILVSARTPSAAAKVERIRNVLNEKVPSPDGP